jgi:DNA replication protein DnaC
MSSVRERLAALGMHGLADELDDVIAHASKRRSAPLALVERMLDIEERERARRSLERRSKRSRVGTFRPMSEFDWAWPKSLPRARVDSALSLDFMREGKNLILIGAHGLGKTMIAKNVVHQAVQHGHSALFVTASDLLLDLGGQESARALDRRLRNYASVGCLCIDELGYLSYDQAGADLFFQLVNRRYEKKPTIITTNKRFAEWGSVFPGAACTTALIDRLVHHAEVIGIQGKSYRLREAQLDGA